MRKPSSAINAKKQKKTTEWERVEISSRKLEIQGNISCKDGLDKDRNGIDLQKQKILRRGGKNTQENCTKKIFMTRIITIV